MVGKIEKWLAESFPDIPLEGWKRIGGGTSNWVYKRRGQVLRWYGKHTQRLVNRKQELKLMKRLSRKGIGPKVICHNQAGRIETLVPGMPLSTLTWRSPYLIEYIGRTIRKMHKVSPKTQSILHKRLFKWWEAIPQKKWKKKLEAPMQQELQLINRYFHEHPSVLCHYDLTLGNFMWDASQSHLQLIDFEYAGPGLASFDLANHLTEWKGLDMKGNPASISEIDTFLQAYLQSDDTYDLKVLKKEIDLLTPTAHLLWTFWACIQSKNNTQDWFDYRQYAKKRMREYQKSYDFRQKWHLSNKI